MVNLRHTFILLAFLASTLAIAQEKPTFKVVLDAGHGGQDPGAVKNGYQEKDIALNVALKLGRILDQQPQIEIVYTRKTDVFVELRERANIANKAKADLFVSIHCNSADKATAANGTETFVMGRARSNTNLEVAKRENSVITLEKDYERKYKGFNPNAPETLIGLTLMQEQFVEQSIILAKKIQMGFTNDLRRMDRGVKQIPLWVLDATVMPGVLIELGFLSNKEEADYLHSEAGQDALSQSIADAILKYVKESYDYDIADIQIAQQQPRVNVPPAVIPEPAIMVKQEARTDASGEVIYKVQIASSTRDLELKPSNFKGLKNISKNAEDSMIKYFFGETSDYEQTKSLLEEAKAKGYTSAFVVAFKDGRKVTVQEALNKR